MLTVVGHVCPGGPYPIATGRSVGELGARQSYRAAKKVKRRDWAHGRRLPVEKQDVIRASLKRQKFVLHGGLPGGGRRSMMGG
ncbi:hypothetical protein MPNT_280028 [Candidatus Methylacidithermus pantelleriae]|uniref:Uncharacterized protein n=1 Tax=Candidatus Methylacidithermus pantelleriae TaxID=2744239 RepID=A0A8J2BL75_9BACT|nr:hypothetical protein MPNT_280028 [Candidatus Methylacidithermus pantelleriae]